MGLVLRRKMYKYNNFDTKLVNERVKQFTKQIKRRISGELSEDEFKPLRLMNGLYLQLHAYMLRVAIPYGELSSTQLRMLAYIAKKYDRGYGHFTTRQNIQFNWPKLSDIPKILRNLAKVEMHAIQTSGNCIRNISADHLAGLTAKEVDDPRPWCELIRKWSTFHPEFSFLPRKFKIAVTGCKEDRAGILVHDIGIRIIKKERIGFEIFVGGGQGRSPFIAKKIVDFICPENLLNYLESILSTYNQLGRRDNIYKARIKILVNELGIEKFKEIVDDRYKLLKDRNVIESDEINKLKRYFRLPNLTNEKQTMTKKIKNKDFDTWLNQNTLDHKVTGYKIILVSLKSKNFPPGDMDYKQMMALSQISDDYSLGQIRVTHEQNLVLPHVQNDKIYDVWKLLQKNLLATPNIGLLSDSICCPGMDYCALATARSIPVAKRITNYFEKKKSQNLIGPLKIKISGCINACGHHHVGNIGILGLDKNGKEFYQITLGGSAKEDASIGKIIGSSFSSSQIIPALDKILDVYLKYRKDKDQTFIQTLQKIGLKPFQKALYDHN